MRSLINTQGLSYEDINSILDQAKSFSDKSCSFLKDKIICLLFYENSTRTQSSFESAVARLGGYALKLDVQKSSKAKGEDLIDTVKNLAALKPAALIMRHQNSGVLNALQKQLDLPLINAGDGKHAHPSQALLDLYTIKEHFKGEDIKNKKIAIVGDIKNSRVANSNLDLLSRFGLDITLIGPAHFLPKTSFKSSSKLKEIINDFDIIMSLRTQTERLNRQIYGSLADYGRDFCIKKSYFLDKIPLILHPGPVHKDIDIEQSLLNHPKCKVLDQVKNGVAIRMAIIKHVIELARRSL